MNKADTKRWIELSPEMTELLHEWADSEYRTDKAQAEYIIERALAEYRDSNHAQKANTKQKAKAA